MPASSATTSMTPSHPPKPRIALSVGVTGHRPNRFPDHLRPEVERGLAHVFAALGREVREAQSRHACFFAESEPLLAIVTSLAEGADSLGAQAALDAGFVLDVVLPFVTEEYQKDFCEAAHFEFHRLRAAARSTLELNGNRSNEGKSYEAAGHVMLDMCDIVVAIWDGSPSAGRGGTAELVSEAARRGMPIIRIDVEGRLPLQIHWRGLGAAHHTPVHIDDHPVATLSDRLEATIDALLRPPAQQSEQSALRRYFDETNARWVTRPEFSILAGLLAVRRLRASDFKLPQPAELSQTIGMEGFGSATLADAFGWADAIAIRFSQMFRSAFVSNFFVSALAVIVGVSSFTPGWTAIEFLCVLFLVLNTTIGQRRHWHRRWIEAREAAERMRVAMTMRKLATRSWGPFGEAATWTAWLVRALLREAGLPGGSLDPAGLRSAAHALGEFLTSQRNYHEATAERFQLLHDRLTTVSKYLFIAALLTSAILLATELSGHSLVPAGVAILVSVALPAFGSTSYGIRVIGEFDGASRRSARMTAQFDSLLAALDKAEDRFDVLRDIARHASEVVLGDVAGWRLVVESRELEMPS